MSYYQILGFQKEPFSTSPDPEFLYMSREHETVLTNTLIELNLQRGLSVIFGDVGTGKTTLSRKLIQELGKRHKFLFQIVLNPSFESEADFLRYLMSNFGIPAESADGEKYPLMELRDRFEKFLLAKTLNEKRIVAVIIDEAQKLGEESLETLRIILNYETNEFKLIQIVLLGQMELHSKISRVQNFRDRISFKFKFYPFDLDETREMINFRIRKAGYEGRTGLFMDDAIREIHMYTGGYPRSITMFCHKALKELLLKNKYVVDVPLVRSIIESERDLIWQTKNYQQSKNY
ncbi:MAG: AAA family ATPase [Candidatus Omnitrophica bacterium]|nr:AAA family ATPase [Candidatus Omnitrophota bacterium]